MASSSPTLFPIDLSPPTNSQQSPRPQQSNTFNSENQPSTNLIDSNQNQSRYRETALSTALAGLAIDTAAAGRDRYQHPPHRTRRSVATDNPEESRSTETSAPIPIPHRHLNSLTSTIPLTARQTTGGYFPFHETSPPTSESASRPLNVIDESPPEPENSSNQPLSSRHHHNISLDQTAVPFSPIMTFPPLPSNPDARASKHPGKKLRLPSLPRFHPAHYQNPNTGNPSSSRAGSPQRQFSDAQQQLHQHQRDGVRSPSALTQGLAARPSPPRLHPLGSPGPVTPMMLEEHADYLGGGGGGAGDVGAGVGASTGGSQGGRIGSLNQMIHGEAEQTGHPGLHPKRQSPA